MPLNLSGISSNRFGTVSNPNNIFNISYMGNPKLTRTNPNNIFNISYMGSTGEYVDNPAYKNSSSTTASNYIIRDDLYFVKPASKEVIQYTKNKKVLKPPQLLEGDEKKEILDIVFSGSGNDKRVSSNDAAALLKGLSYAEKTTKKPIVNGIYKDNEYYYKYNNGEITIVYSNGRTTNVYVGKDSKYYQPILDVISKSSGPVKQAEFDKLSKAASRVPESDITSVSVPPVSAKIKMKAKSSKGKGLLSSDRNKKIAIGVGTLLTVTAIIGYMYYAGSTDDKIESKLKNEERKLKGGRK